MLAKLLAVSLLIDGLTQAAYGPSRPLFAYTPNLRPDMKDAGTGELFPMGDCNGFELEEATIEEMWLAMESGALTSVQLVTCYLVRTYQTQEYIK